MSFENTVHEIDKVRWIGVADVVQLQQLAYGRIVNAAAQAIAQRGQFIFVLAGGNTPRGIYQRLTDAPTDWTRWHIYFGDERCLPADDANRNSMMAADAWLEHVAIPQNQIHVIPAELGASAASLIYAETLHSVADFDLVLLGLGEDGHTASLFPGHYWGVAESSPNALAVFDAPKLPTERVTLSAQRLNKTREVLFVIAGETKRNAVARWQAGADLPCRAIGPPSGVAVLVESRLLIDEVPGD